MMKTKEEWATIYKEARAEWDKIENKEKREQALALVGKCFKYRNSYGAGEKRDWWLYAIITGVKYAWPEAFEFEMDCNGEIRITRKSHIFLNNGWTEIHKSVFLREWRKLNQKITSMVDRGFQK